MLHFYAKLGVRARSRLLFVLLLLGACHVYDHESPHATKPSGDAGAAHGDPTSAGAPLGGEDSTDGESSAGTSGDAGNTSVGSGAAGNGASGTDSGATNGGAGGLSGAAPQGGQAGASAGAATQAGAAGAEPVVPTTPEAIDDMEDGDAFVLATKERNGHWDVSNDGTPGATQAPMPANFVMVELGADARQDSLLSSHTRGSGFKDWGAFMTVSMRTWPKYEETPVYDARAYVGISFFAKVAAGSDTTLRVRVVGAQTDARGGQCTPGGSVETACYDHFYADVKLSPSWQKVELSFHDFKQAGVGKTFPTLDLARMYALEFFFPGRKTSSGNSFELWLDDLSFLVPVK